MLMGHSAQVSPSPTGDMLLGGTGLLLGSLRRKGWPSESLHEAGGLAPGMQLWTWPPLPTPSLRMFTLSITLELLLRKTVSTRYLLSFILQLLLSGFKWYVLVFGAIHTGWSRPRYVAYRHTHSSAVRLTDPLTAMAVLFPLLYNC